MSKKKGTFDVLINLANGALLDGLHMTGYDPQEKREIRAAVKVLRECESCAINDGSIGLGIMGSMRVCRAVLTARRIAEKGEEK